eukprot:360090-Chlamydomonas_euryale.AAC.1
MHTVRSRSHYPHPDQPHGCTQYGPAATTRIPTALACACTVCMCHPIGYMDAHKCGPIPTAMQLHRARVRLHHVHVPTDCTLRQRQHGVHVCRIDQAAQHARCELHTSRRVQQRDMHAHSASRRHAPRPQPCSPPTAQPPLPPRQPRQPLPPPAIVSPRRMGRRCGVLHGGARPQPMRRRALQCRRGRAASKAATNDHDAAAALARHGRPFAAAAAAPRRARPCGPRGSAGRREGP